MWMWCTQLDDPTYWRPVLSEQSTPPGGTMAVAHPLSPEALQSTADRGERQITYVEALNEALREEMRRDSSVFVMGEDVAVWGGGGVFGVTKGLVEEFGT